MICIEAFTVVLKQIWKTTKATLNIRNGHAVFFLMIFLYLTYRNRFNLDGLFLRIILDDELCFTIRTSIFFLVLIFTKFRILCPQTMFSCLSSYSANFLE